MPPTTPAPTGVRAGAEEARRPLTGDEYLDSLRDGREVWLHGERVRDVTTHPAFRNTARMLARLYDALHDPARNGTLTTGTDTGSGGFTHRFYRASRSAEELVGARDAIAEWARLTYGWMGRSPDYKAAFLATLDSNAEFYAPYQDNARRWYREAQERVSFWNHAIVHPPVDRDLPPSDVHDVYVHVERETDAGIVVSGAKVVATGSAFTHHNFIAHHGPVPIEKPEFAAVFALPMDTPGVKLLCRPSYEYRAAATASPFDAPLSSRLDENDAIFVLDRVLVPWENVLLYRDLRKANMFLPRTGAFPRLLLHGCTRLAVKLDFIAGLLLKAVEIAGTSRFRGVEVNVGEVLAWRNLFWSLSEAMVRNPDPWVGGAVLPNAEAAAAYQALGPEAYARVRNLIEKTVASGLIFVNSHAVDFKTPELRPYLDRYLRGSNGCDALGRVKLMKLLWDAVGSEFGGRHELYEMNYSGNVEDIRRFALFGALASKTTERLKQFAERCMAEYDVDGWRQPDLFDPDDVSVVRPAR
jgi:4-hydroxyphenylacetate 3-monooxygenase